MPKETALGARYFTIWKITRRFCARLMSVSRVLAGSAFSFVSMINRDASMPAATNWD
jgi:hypothetical protein